MRMNAVPRSASEGLGHIYHDIAGEDASRYSIGEARKFLHNLTTDEWDHTRPKDAALSGADYKNVLVVSGWVLGVAIFVVFHVAFLVHAFRWRLRTIPLVLLHLV